MTKHEAFEVVNNYDISIRAWVITARIEKIYGINCGLVDDIVFISNASHHTLSIERAAIYLPFIIDNVRIDTRKL